ncbi:hypothetical protein [Lacticaseibacillus manihotivorans]|uniref:hypothetical protein n=1 Tax=Lacticaseibacillus manihotivorans TaxID=88233 RepID=UPI0006D1F3C1|nr:hypothetical protein [Lacticaseibacillus manihotivorans]
MTQTSWLDSREATVAHIHELLKQPMTDASNLEIVNQMRAQSGDRPLTMTEYLDVLEKSKRGIHSYDEVPQTKPFFQRLRQALKK